MCDIPTELYSLLRDIAESENFQNYSIRCSDGSDSIDGFNSDIRSVQIIEEKKNENGVTVVDQLSLVCKSAFPEPTQREEFKSHVTFERETIFYRDVAPAFLKFQRDRGLNEEDIFNSFPKCHRIVFEPEREKFIIILEDMRPKGFQMLPKTEISKVKNTRLIIRELAKWHAISFAMRDQCPEEFAKFENLTDLWPTYHDSSGAFSRIYLQNYKRLIKMFDNPEHKRIYQLLHDNLHNYSLSASDGSVPRKFRVVCHGDAWNNNILLKLNKDNIAGEASFLDWQLMRYATPALDLLYHIFTSTDKQFRDLYYDELLHLYYDQLSSNIRKLGSDPDSLYSFEQLLEGFKFGGNFGFVTIPCILIFILAKNDDLLEIKNFSGSSETNAIKDFVGETAEEFKKRATDVVDDLLRFGYFREIPK